MGPITGGTPKTAAKKPAALKPTPPPAPAPQAQGQNPLPWVITVVLAVLLTGALFFWREALTSNPAAPALEATTTAAQPTYTQWPTQAYPTLAPTTASIELPAAGPVACRDGELVLNHLADQDGTLPRTPVGEAERADILEVGVSGDGFGGYNRFIVVVPRLGPVWMVNILPGARTIASWGFCGTNEAVASWAIQAHVPQFQQASRDVNGDQPQAEEIGVYLLNYEERTLTEVKAAPSGLTAQQVLAWLEVSFHEGENISNVPLHVTP